GRGARGKDGPEDFRPQVSVLAEEGPAALAPHLTPVYPSTEGLQQVRLRKLLEQVFAQLQREQTLPDYLPEALARELGFMPLLEALRVLHYPPPEVSLAQLTEGRHPAQQRLAFEELLAHYLGLQRLRDQARSDRAPALRKRGELQQALLQQLPFALTGAQQR